MPFDGTGFDERRKILAEDLPPSDRIGRALCRARDHVNLAWCTGETEKGDAVCALGGISRATGYSYVIIEPGAIHVYQWNDSRQSKYEVVALFDIAIESAGRRKFSFTKKGVAKGAVAALCDSLSK